MCGPARRPAAPCAAHHMHRAGAGVGRADRAVSAMAAASDRVSPTPCAQRGAPVQAVMPRQGELADSSRPSLGEPLGSSSTRLGAQPGHQHTAPRRDDQFAGAGSGRPRRAPWPGRGQQAKRDQRRQQRPAVVLGQPAESALVGLTRGGAASTCHDAGSSSRPPCGSSRTCHTGGFDRARVERQEPPGQLDQHVRSLVMRHHRPDQQAADPQPHPIGVDGADPQIGLEPDHVAAAVVQDEQKRAGQLGEICCGAELLVEQLSQAAQIGEAAEQTRSAASRRCCAPARGSVAAAGRPRPPRPPGRRRRRRERRSPPRAAADSPWRSAAHRRRHSAARPQLTAPALQPDSRPPGSRKPQQRPVGGPMRPEHPGAAVGRRARRGGSRSHRLMVSRRIRSSAPPRIGCRNTGRASVGGPDVRRGRARHSLSAGEGSRPTSGASCTAAPGHGTGLLKLRPQTAA